MEMRGLSKVKAISNDAPLKSALKQDLESVPIQDAIQEKRLRSLTCS